MDQYDFNGHKIPARNEPDMIFYDTEATDVDVRHAQITQFGAIITDEKFRVLKDGEINIRIARSPWVVPAPRALEVTKQTPQSLSEGISIFEGSKQMSKTLTPGYGKKRTLVTFNGINFDDELLRTTFFSNFQNPWFSSGAATSRVDVLHLVKFAKSLNPDALNVPFDEETGKLTWRLEKLCEANGITLDAHDAFSDAMGTMEIANLIQETTPEAWETLCRVGSAKRQEDIFSSAHQSGMPILLFQHYGEAKVIPCAVLGTNKQKRWILKDLRAENAPEDKESIKENMFAKEDKCYLNIRTNAAPITLSPDLALRIDPTIDIQAMIEASKALLKSDIKTQARLAMEESVYEKLPNMTSEEKIYSGFLGDRDKPLVTEFIKSDNWEKRLSINFEDDRMQDFKARILLNAHMRGEVNFPDETVQMLRDQCEEVLNRPYNTSEDARYMTIAKAIKDNVSKEWADWAEKEFATDIPNDKIIEDEPSQMQMLL